MVGKLLRIFLVDGIPSGLVLVDIANFTGKILLAPRSQLARLLKRDEVKKTGIYILFGSDPKNPDQDIVYIGESDNIQKRLIQHENNKEFWEKTIVIVSSDDNLTKAHIRYMESRLIQITKQANRARLDNENGPEPTRLPEADIAVMDDFIEQIQLTLPVLGFNFTKQVPKAVPEISKSGSSLISPIFNISYDTVKAKAQENSGEFIVLKDSQARKKQTPSLADSYRDIRSRLIKEGILVSNEENGDLIFTQSVPFRSPSTAATVVCGSSINGRTQWRLAEDNTISYAKWMQDRLENSQG